MALSDVDLRLRVGFDFAKRLRSPAFRARLTTFGWRSGINVVPALDSESVNEVVARMVANQTTSPCVIAIPSVAEPHEFCLMLVAVVPPRWMPSWRRRTPTIKVCPGASIGMLYAALRRCGEYVPSEWSRTLRFEKVSAVA